MGIARELCFLARRIHRTPLRQPLLHRRSTATHSYSHHATALSVLPSNVDIFSAEYNENARQFGEVVARMQELHKTTEQGGPQKAKEKHTAKGKMLPRE